MTKPPLTPSRPSLREAFGLGLGRALTSFLLVVLALWLTWHVLAWLFSIL
jgi:hypothetical protein